MGRTRTVQHDQGRAQACCRIWWSGGWDRNGECIMCAYGVSARRPTVFWNELVQLTHNVCVYVVCFWNQSANHPGTPNATHWANWSVSKQSVSHLHSVGSLQQWLSSCDRGYSLLPHTQKSILPILTVCMCVTQYWLDNVSVILAVNAVMLPGSHTLNPACVYVCVCVSCQLNML